MDNLQLVDTLIQGVDLPEIDETNDGFDTSIVFGRFDGTTASVEIGIPFEEQAVGTDRGAVMVVDTTSAMLVFADDFVTGTTAAWMEPQP